MSDDNFYYDDEDIFDKYQREFEQTGNYLDEFSDSSRIDFIDFVCDKLGISPSQRDSVISYVDGLLNELEEFKEALREALNRLFP